jgi:hypothetical protein
VRSVVPRGWDEHLKVQLFDRGVRTPLGWLLSARATKEIVGQFDGPGTTSACESVSERVKYTNFCSLVFIAEFVDRNKIAR